MSPKEYSPKPGKKFKDMDRRPVPMHIDDMAQDDSPDEKWVPGSRKKASKPKDAKQGAEEPKKNTQELVTGSFDIFHLLLIAVIGFGAVAGIIFLVTSVSQVYGIDLWGQMRHLIDPLIGPAENLPVPAETANP